PADDRRAVPPDRRRGAAGPAARRSASSSIARWTVIESTSSPRRSEALVSPSVTYGPYRPSVITLGRLAAGSSPRSRRGGAAAPGLGLVEQILGLGERDGEKLLLAIEGTAVAALLHIGPVPSVLHGDGFTVEFAKRARQREQAQGVVQCHGVQRHRLQQR